MSSNSLTTSPRSVDAQLTDDLALADTVRDAVMGLARRLRSHHVDKTLTPAETAVLSRLYIHGPMSPSGIADIEQLLPSAVARLLTRLQNRELVKRKRNPEDARSYIISLTREGSRVVRANRVERNAWLAAEISSLSPNERRRLVSALEVMRSIGRNA